MEEQTIEWQKDYVIVKDGTLWRIRNSSQYVPGAFTTRFHAEQALKGLQNSHIAKTIKAETNKIRKSGKDIKTRMKEYKELCQQIPEYS
jgi:hypothetical protein